ncbi:MAG: choice-of-anchor V domain-containing protein [Bryobacteraceae bacterium]
MTRLLIFTAVTLSLVTSVRAEDHGPDVRLTGAPGDENCTSCHTGAALNGGGGSVAIETPSGNIYTPGEKQTLLIRIADSTARRYGFEITARLASDRQNGQAGSFAALDGNTQVKCDNGRNAPCASASVVQFAQHTLTGYRSSTGTYSVSWTPPETAVGPVILYVAGNAANGNGNNQGDHIYTTSMELTPAASGPKPTISATSGVVNGASFESTIAAGTWITIRGQNLATTTRAWSGADIVDGTLPAALDGVSVSVNGKAAYVQYISPTQINALSPADAALGAVEVRVTAGGQTSDAATATMQATAPALFTFDGKYAAATHSDNALLGKVGLFASAPSATSPAKPGETIVLFGTGFGATIPLVEGGRITSALAPLADALRVTIGGVAAEVVFAGLVPNFARLYQLNVKVPDAVPDGDLAIVIEAGGASSPAGTLITVQR